MIQSALPLPEAESAQAEDSEAMPARNIFEPLRMKALSNSAGVGPRRSEWGGAPRAVKIVTAILLLLTPSVRPAACQPNIIVVGMQRSQRPRPANGTDDVSERSHLVFSSLMGWTTSSIVPGVERLDNPEPTTYVATLRRVSTTATS